MPNQVGRVGNSKDAWIKEIDNCVIVCESCHNRVHENDRFRMGATAVPDYFLYLHGNEQNKHKASVARLRSRF